MLLRRMPFGLWLALLVSSAWAAPPATQCEWSGVERIVAVGDVHGDFEQFVTVLRAAGVIDEKNHWSAGKAHLVQTGDILDRGPGSRKAMDLVMALEAEADKAGGHVHPLIGNHEAVVIGGDLRYMRANELATYGGKEALAKLMAPDGIYGRWIRSHNAIVKINDVVFLHGGLSERYAAMTLADINAGVRKGLDAASDDNMASEDAGPLWNRDLALGGDRAETVATLDKLLTRFGARHMVIGHTFDVSGVRVQSEGRLIRIDVGMSAVFKGPAACLVIEKGVYSEVRAPDTKTRLDVPAATSQPAGK